MRASLSTRTVTVVPAAAWHAPGARQQNSKANPRPVPAIRPLLCYVEGWAQADAVKIAAAVSVDYSFVDPLVGRFDRDSLHEYIAILQQRAGLCGSRFASQKVQLNAFPGAQWPALRLRFWRSLPECGLSGTSDIELSGQRVRRDVVCYEPSLAVEYLRGVASAQKPSAA